MMPMSAVVPFTDLQALSGHDTPGRVEAWCEKNHVPYFIGKGGTPSTTLTALNAALGLAQNDESADEIQFDE